MVIKNNTDPIWTVDAGSLCGLSATASDFFASSTGRTCILEDYDIVGSNEVIGQVVLSHTEVVEAKGERVEYEIEVNANKPPKKAAIYPPKLNIRSQTGLARRLSFSQDAPFDFQE